MEYEKAKSLIQKLVIERIEKLEKDCKEFGLDEETQKLIASDIVEAFNVLIDIGEIKDLVHDKTKKYNHAMDLAFEVWSNDLYSPSIDEILAGLWRRVSYFFQKENHIELKEATTTYDVYKNENWKNGEQQKEKESN